MARSMKVGKTGSTIKQLEAYRAFGAPDVSLLDVYVCEAGFMRSNRFPPKPVRDSIVAKLPELAKRGFGYQLLPFEHDKDGYDDVGLRFYSRPTSYGSPTTNLRLLPVARTDPAGGFVRLVERLHRCYEQGIGHIPRRGKGFVAIVFCRECRELALTPMRDTHACPNCGADLWLQ
jgi:hypothetical protein